MCSSCLKYCKIAALDLNKKWSQKMNIIFTLSLQEVFSFKNSFSLIHWKIPHAGNSVLQFFPYLKSYAGAIFVLRATCFCSNKVPVVPH
jgi:hypothetical protein